ncbi:hypothetical protein GCM10008992_32130 [Halorubrum aquaticum]
MVLRSHMSLKVVYNSPEPARRLNLIKWRRPKREIEDVLGRDDKFAGLCPELCIFDILFLKSLLKHRSDELFD